MSPIAPAPPRVPRPGGAVPPPAEFLPVQQPGGAPPQGSARRSRSSERGSRVGRQQSALQDVPGVEAPPMHKPPKAPGCLEVLWMYLQEKFPEGRAPLVVALILLMALPSCVLLVTGSWKRTGCTEDQAACREQCRVSWDIRKSELVGEAKYVVRNELEKTQECYDECDAVAGRCSTEVMMLFIGVGCFAGACACAIAMGLLIGKKGSEQVQEIEAPRPRQKRRDSAFDKKSDGSTSSRSGGSDDRPASGRKKGDASAQEEPEEVEEMTEEERMYERERKKMLKSTSRVSCPDCEKEFRTRLPFGQRAMGVSPVVCPFCGYVVAGLL